jgi:hypothetical protein
MSKDDQIKPSEKLSLQPTASLVILWSLPLYAKSPAPVRRFVEMLDLSSGEDLLRRCDEICDWYGEVILNRKYFLKYLVVSLLAESVEVEEEKEWRAEWEERREEVAGEKAAEGKVQIVILAAGKSPLALELLIENPARIAKIFEVDLAGIEEKGRLYSRVAPDLAERLRCLTVDVVSEDLLDRLALEGFDPDAPVIVLMEGISYYLSKKSLEEIVLRFRSGGRNRIIVEYLVPCSKVRADRRPIPKGIFSLIREEAKTGGTACYTRAELSDLFRRSGGREISCFDMSEMERLRLGKNKRFCSHGDGWIEAFLGVI